MRVQLVVFKDLKAGNFYVAWGSAQKSARKGRVVCDVDLNGKTILITGANQGIGYETALDLAGRGARVIMACRDMGKAEDSKKDILNAHPNADVMMVKLDLSSLDSVRECAKVVNETESRLDVLINNAGLMFAPEWKTKEGYEMHMGVNHIGHFLLTNLLLDLIKRSSPSRIVIVSSITYNYGAKQINWDDVMFDNGYDAPEAYYASKLANIYHCLELSKRLEGTGVTCNCLHPGVVKTSLWQHRDGGHQPCLERFFFLLCGTCFNQLLITPDQGAQTTIYCAIAPELESISGKYFNKCKPQRLERHALREDEAKKLWEMSEEWVKDKN